jgi:hypothetical protein
MRKTLRIKRQGKRKVRSNERAKMARLLVILSHVAHEIRRDFDECDLVTLELKVKLFELAENLHAGERIVVSDGYNTLPRARLEKRMDGHTELWHC